MVYSGLFLVSFSEVLALLLLGGGVPHGGALPVLLLLHLEGQLALEVPDGAVLVGGAGLRVDPAPARHVHVQLLVFKHTHGTARFSPRSLMQAFRNYYDHKNVIFVVTKCTQTNDLQQLIFLVIPFYKPTKS